MSLPLLLGIFIASAVVVHVARYWRPLAFVASVAAPLLLVWAVYNATDSSFDLLGVTFQLQPLSRDYLKVALAISGVLAIATSFGDVRRTLGFMFWSWIAWLVALTVNEFVLGVFAWASGLAIMVIAMEPRRIQRVGGAAYFLVLIIIASALLLIGNRFAELYPLTPDQVSLIDSSILFLTWGFGLLLAIVPFSAWLGPMADETPLPIIAVLLGLGQPIGLWLLYELIGQFPRLLEQSNLLTILTDGGIAAIVVGGGLCSIERRAGRLMSFAALYALGFVLLDLSRGTLEGTAFAVIETFARALGLATISLSVTIGRTFENHWVKYLGLIVFLLGGLTIAGLAPGVSLAARWNLLLELEATDRRIFFAAILATVGVLIGVARFVMLWLESIQASSFASNVAEPTADAPRTMLQRLGYGLTGLVSNVAHRLPMPLRRGTRAVMRNWRAAFAFMLLGAVGAFMLWYNAVPNIWLQRALDTVGQLAFLR